MGQWMQLFLSALQYESYKTYLVCFFSSKLFWTIFKRCKHCKQHKDRQHSVCLLWYMASRNGCARCLIKL